MFSGHLYKELLFLISASVKSFNIPMVFSGDRQEVGQAGPEAAGTRRRERPRNRPAGGTGKWRHLPERTVLHEDNVAFTLTR